MKRKLHKRYITEGNQLQKCMTFRISHCVQHSYQQSFNTKIKSTFAEKRNRIIELPLKAPIKISTKRILENRVLREKTTAALNIARLTKFQTCEFAEIIMIQIQKSKRFAQGHRRKEGSQIINEIFRISQRIYEQLYSYKTVQDQIQNLHSLVKQLGSSTFLYRVFAYSGFSLFQYGNYSLSLYYLDRAFKCFYDRDTPTYYKFQRRLELQLYKCVSRIFLAKERYIQAKNFAYKLLRKSWNIEHVDQQMFAYDLLGKIYMELQNKSMSRYFHHRMVIGQPENSEIIAMSRQQLSKQACQHFEFVCYQTINIFVENDLSFNQILQNHYRMRSLEYSKDVGEFHNEDRQVYIYTHHSPNRILSNYRVLQRKLIEAKQSKQIHFVKPKDSLRLKKIFSEFSSTVNEIRLKYQSTCYPTEFNIKQSQQN